jgi:hypothetical protein
MDRRGVRSCPIVAQFLFETLHRSNSFRAYRLDVKRECGADVRVPEYRLNRSRCYANSMKVCRKTTAKCVPAAPFHSTTLQSWAYDFASHRGQVPRATARPGEDESVHRIPLGVFIEHTSEKWKHRNRRGSSLCLSFPDLTTPDRPADSDLVRGPLWLC